MARAAFHVAETALGWIGLVWTSAGISGLALPGPDPARTRRQLARRFPNAAEQDRPPLVTHTLRLLREMLDGKRVDFATVAVDLADAPAFNRRVYDVAREVGWGETTTYGAIATRLGEPGAARAVGAALGQNPVPIIVPCHRVLAAGGRSGGFTAPGGVLTKLKLLALEGVAPAGQPDLFVR